MAATPSTMLPLGTALPTFELVDTRTGALVRSAEFAGAPLLVAILCNHCPYVKHVQLEFSRCARELAERGVRTVGISSNDVEGYPQDGPELMRAEAEHAGYTFPYLFDADQSVAKAFEAACTPEFYLFDAASKLVYRGQFDGSRPKNTVPVTGADVRKAVDALLRSEGPLEEQIPSIGCNIKWKGGVAPAYLQRQP